MESPKKNPDTLNTIGIVTVGAVGSALVYLSIVGLQAFYVNETSHVDAIASFGDQEKTRTSLKSKQVGAITEPRRMWQTPEGKPVISIPIDAAKSLIVRDAAVDPANLVPTVGKSEKSTIQPVFGRPIALPQQPPAPTAPVTPDPAGGPVPPGGAPGEAPAGGAAIGPATVTPGTPGSGQPASNPGNPPTPAAPSVQPPGAAPVPPAGGAGVQPTPPAGGAR